MNIQSFFANHFRGILIITLCIVASFISFGYLCFNIAIAGDDWTNLVSGDFLNKYMVSIGRWNHYLISTFFHKRVMAPTFTFSVFVLALSISAYITSVKILPLRSFLSQLIFSLLFVIYPIWFEGYIFNVGRLPKAAGLLLSVCGAYTIIYVLKQKQKSLRSNWHLLLLGIFMIVLSIGCYQTNLFFGLFLLGVYLIEIITKDDLNRIIQQLSIIIVTSFLIVLLYALCSKLFILLIDVTIQSEGHYGIANPVTSGNLSQSISDTFKQIWFYYTKSELLIPQIVKIFGLISFIFYVFSVLKNQTNNKLIGVALKILICAALLILPWSLGFIRGLEAFRYNSLTVLSLSYAFFFAYIFDTLYINYKKLRPIIYTVASLTILWLSFMNSSSSFSKHISNKRDFALSEKLLTYIHNSHNYSGNPKKLYKIYFVGNNPYRKKIRPMDLINKYDLKIPNLINEGIWDGQIGRMKNLFTILGEPGKRFRFYSSNSPKSKVIDYAFLKENMIGNYTEIRPWPHKNSVISLKDKRSFVVLFDKHVLFK